MKIFEFQWPELQKDWVLAPDLEEAKEFYLNFTGCGDLEVCIISEIPKKEWSEMYILDPNDNEPYDGEEKYNEDDYCNGLKIIESFADYAKDNYTTDIIATTEF